MTYRYLMQTMDINHSTPVRYTIGLTTKPMTITMVLSLSHIIKYYKNKIYTKTAIAATSTNQLYVWY